MSAGCINKVSERQAYLQPRMKITDVKNLRIVQAGRRFKLPATIQLRELIKIIDRDESTVFWMQPRIGSVSDQFPCICVNNTFYALNCKMEKVIFRDVRLGEIEANLKMIHTMALY